MSLSINIVRRGNQSAILSGSYISGNSSDNNKKRIKLSIAGTTIDIEATGRSGTFNFSYTITGLSPGTHYSWSCNLFEYRTSYWYQLSDYTDSGSFTTYSVGTGSFRVSIAESGSTTAKLSGSFFSGYDNNDQDATYLYPRYLRVVIAGVGTVDIQSKESSGHNNNFSYEFTGLAPGTTYSWTCTLYYQSSGGLAPSSYSTSGSFKTDGQLYHAYMTFDTTTNGGSGYYPATQGSSTTYGGKASFSMPSTSPGKTGWSFKCWRVTADGTTYTVSSGGSIQLPCYDTSTPGTHYTAVAVWQATFYGKLSFSANGGSGAPPSSTGNKVAESSGEMYTFTMPQTVPQRSGFEFQYWQVTVGSTTHNKLPSTADSTVTISVPLYSTDKDSPTTYTMYAIWKELEGSVLMYYGGQWSRAVPYVYYDNEWKRAVPYVYRDGWKQAK